MQRDSFLSPLIHMDLILIEINTYRFIVFEMTDDGPQFLSNSVCDENGGGDSEALDIRVRIC